MLHATQVAGCIFITAEMVMDVYSAPASDNDGSDDDVLVSLPLHLSSTSMTQPLTHTTLARSCPYHNVGRHTYLVVSGCIRDDGNNGSVSSGLIHSVSSPQPRINGSLNC